MQGADLESQIAYRQATGELNKAQADTLRAQQPYVAQKMLADIEANKAITDERRQQILRSETLLPHEKNKMLADIERDKAAAAASNAQTRRTNELIDYEKQQITANINRDNAAAGLSKANEARINATFPLERQELEKKVQQYVNMEIKTPGGSQTGTVQMKDLLNEINDSRNKMAQRVKDHEALKRQARADDLKASETAAKYENHIKQRSPGGYKMQGGGDEELSPDVDMFHATSKNPYIYILEKDPGLVGSTPRYKRRDLPKVNGHQFTAQEIYDLAEADDRQMTVQQYMEQVFYPHLKQPAPWNSAVTSTLPLTQSYAAPPVK